MTRSPGAVRQAREPRRLRVMLSRLSQRSLPSYRGRNDRRPWTARKLSMKTQSPGRSGSPTRFASQLGAEPAERAQRPFGPARPGHVVVVEHEVGVALVAEQHGPLDRGVVPRLHEREAAPPLPSAPEIAVGLTCHLTPRLDGTLAGRLEYAVALFDRATVASLATALGASAPVAAAAGGRPIP